MEYPTQEPGVALRVYASRFTTAQTPEIPRGVQLRALFVATNAFAHPETTSALLQPPVPLASF
ncbi:hypothetical protein T484DRAFT_1793099 [Baffinella frigidus]|nr:hypothetical protein T484DRAFT_1793099 [Cryptophyta sp. CCMP2293]